MSLKMSSKLPPAQGISTTNHLPRFVTKLQANIYNNQNVSVKKRSSTRDTALYASQVSKTIPASKPLDSYIDYVNELK